MHYFQVYAAQFLILLFISITFLFSGFEKIFQWKFSLEFYTKHFEKTFFKNQINYLLVFYPYRRNNLRLFSYFGHCSNFY